MEVFFCTCARSGFRAHLAAACLAWVRSCRNAEVTLINTKDAALHVRDLPEKTIYCSDKDFQKLRRVHADEFAKGEVYVVMDDDCLPQKDFLAAFDWPDDFAILSTMPSNANIQPWTPENYQPVLNDWLMEHHNVGQIRFTQRGLVRDWPAQDGPGYDAAHCNYLRSLGYRVGYLRNIKHLHIGEGASSIW